MGFFFGIWKGRAEGEDMRAATWAAPHQHVKSSKVSVGALWWKARLYMNDGAWVCNIDGLNLRPRPLVYCKHA